MKNEKINKRFILYDANMVKWVIEQDPRNGMWWGHVEGDNEEFSGEVSSTFSGVIRLLHLDGYFDEE